MKKDQKSDFFDLKEIILQKIKKNGGWVNCHAHIDRAFTITEDNFKLANKYRHEKWLLNAELRKTSTTNQIYDRMSRATELLLSQGVSVCGTFIDVDPDVKDKAIKASQKLRETYKKDMTFKFINQSSYGIFTKETREWFDRGAEYVDIIGGLLKSAAGQGDEYLDILLSTAKEKKKMVHVHIDELNTPDEKETEMLLKKILEHDMEGKVVGIHGISLNTHRQGYRKMNYKLMKLASFMMISCPMSWLDSRRSETRAPIHNPIAPVDELLKHNIPVGIGVDNIADIFLPLNDGNMWADLKALIYENRLYDIDEAVKIATSYGRKTLGI
ncbi:MAG TPA: amidohydrolase family protein [Candidatus Saccharimonadales bacterium]|nr:amidohydrolase family protein [Candidatus Saccharimonadales bacterium]